MPTLNLSMPHVCAFFSPELPSCYASRLPFTLRGCPDFHFIFCLRYRGIVHLPSDDDGTERTWFEPEQRPRKRVWNCVAEDLDLVRGSQTRASMASSWVYCPSARFGLIGCLQATVSWDLNCTATTARLRPALPDDYTVIA